MSRKIITDILSISIFENAAIEDAINKINSGGVQICLVVSENLFLKGIVTDSDLRRALLSNISIKQSVEKIMNKEPITIENNLSDNEIDIFLIRNKIFHLPMVNEFGIVTGLYISKQYEETIELDQTLVIMAGGRGKRMMPLTQNTPKPMLEVKGKPIIERIIKKAEFEGFKNILISIAYLGDQFIEYFGDGEKFGVNISYIKEDFPLGTAGPLSLIPEKYLSNRILVTNGDVLCNLSYSELLQFSIDAEYEAVIATSQYEMQNPFGVIVAKDDKLISIDEKPIYYSLINAGIYSISPNLIKLINRNKYLDMPDLIKLALNKDYKLGVYRIADKWIDIGRPEDFLQAQSI